MDKKLLFQNLSIEIDLQLQLVTEAAQKTLDMATHEESKPENKYDTRGLEASYLARAQSERVLDLKLIRNGILSLKVRDFDSTQKIALTALVELESKEKTLWLLLLPKGGGHSFKHETILIKVITPESPMGSQLIGKSVHDLIQIKNLEYLIVGLY